MPNTTIIFTPTRAILSSPPPDDGAGTYDDYTIQITLSEFNHSADDKTSKLTSLSGRTVSTLYFFNERY